MTKLRIKELMKDRQLTYKALTAKSGVYSESIARAVKGDNSIKLVTLEKIAMALECDVKDLFY